MRVTWMVVLLGVAGGCERGPVLRQPVGESTGGTTRLTSAPVQRAPAQDASTSTSAEARGEPDVCADIAPRVEFSFDSTVIDQAEDAELQRLARCLATPSLASATVLVVGRTDTSGSSSYNLALGLERARSVRDQLVKYGVSAARITTATSGEAGAARETTAQARRVDVWIRHEGSVAAPSPAGQAGTTGIPLWGPPPSDSR